jgi:hypothetical protein
MTAPAQWRALGVAILGSSRARVPIPSAVRAHDSWRRCHPSRAAGAAGPDADADDRATTARDDDEQVRRRVAYNRMRHERDRANRRARRREELQALSPQQLEERRDKGRRDAEARRAALAAAAEDKDGTLFIAVDCAYEPDGGVGEAAAAVEHPTPTTAPLHAPKAVRSLAKQLELCVAANRRAPRPARLFATSYGGPLAAFCARMGADAWPLLEKHERSLLEVFPPPDSSSPSSSSPSSSSSSSSSPSPSSSSSRRLVVLSPDAPLPLLPLGGAPLDRACVYVVGGIVDRTVKKGLTLAFAERHGLEARRLPVAEAAAVAATAGGGARGLGRLCEPGASKRPVLNVSDVVACLLAYEACGGDWAEALGKAMPARKLVAGVEGAGARGGRRGRRRQQTEAGAQDGEDGSSPASLL